MFSLIKKVFKSLNKSFIRFSVRVVKVSDQTKSVSCMIRPTFIDLNLIELKYYPFMISLDKCTGSCNNFSPKQCVQKETKDINVKVFNMATNKN